MMTRAMTKKKMAFTMITKTTRAMVKMKTTTTDGVEDNMAMTMMKMKTVFARMTMAKENDKTKSWRSERKDDNQRGDEKEQ